MSTCVGPAVQTILLTLQQCYLRLVLRYKGGLPWLIFTTALTHSRPLGRAAPYLTKNWTKLVVGAT